MIANDEQLAIVRQQIARMEDGIASLAKTVRPKSEQQFRVLAEGHVDQLEILQEDVRAYLGISAAKRSTPEIEISIDDPGAGLGETRVSAVTKLADRFRRALRTTVVSIRDSMSAADRENASDSFLDRLCDPPLQAIAPGSVKIQLASPHGEVGNELYTQGLALLSLVIRSAAGDVNATLEFSKLPIDQQKAALTAAKILAPERGELVGRVGLGGRFVGAQRHIQFDLRTRKLILKRLSHIARQSVNRTVSGVMREVDFGRRLFTLREPETELLVERCKYGKLFDAKVDLLANRAVEVTGVRRLSALRATRLRVKNLGEIKDGESPTA